MKQRKALFTMLLILILSAASALAGCSGNNGGETQSSPSQTALPQATNSVGSNEPEPLAPYEISVFLPGNAQQDEVMVEERLNELMKGKINATVDINFVSWSEYQERTNLMMSTGEAFDLVFASQGYQFFTNQAKGAFLPLDDDSLSQHGNLLEQYGQGILSVIDPLYLLGPVVKGNLYAVPTNKEIAQGLGLAFRKDIVEKYNFDLSSIKSLKDVEPFLQVIKDSEPDIYPVYTNKQDSVLDWMPGNGFESIGNGVSLDLATDEIVTITNPKYAELELEGYQLLHGWYNRGYVNQNAATTQESISDIREAGKIWFMPTVTKPGRDAELRNLNRSGSGPEYYEWEVVTLVPPIVTTGAATGSQFAISRTAKDPARAMMFLDLMYTDKEILNTFLYGLADKHYTKIADNRIKLIPDSGYQSGANWIIGNQLINYLLETEAEDKYEQYVAFNKTAEQSKLLGFVFEPDAVRTQIASFSSINSEFRDILRTGIIDPVETLNSRNDRMNSGGIQAIADELSKQLGEWKAANGK